MPDRLVIRIKLPSRDPHGAPARPRLSRAALLVSGAAIAVALVFIGIWMFGAEPTPPSAVSEAVPKLEPRPSPQPASPPSEPAPVTSEQAAAPAASTATVNEVIPDVPRSARETIRGTIKVLIRVIVDEHGKVLAATTDVPGPSRYFERLATEAAKQWTFPPAAAGKQRIMVLTFSFRRSGTTASASSVR
ncbi:MAG TPA: TonB family protein [Steroidobacteraceae bacterium]|jgi:TonB family protein